MLRKIYDFFLLGEFRLSRYEIVLLMVIAYCFSVAIRFYYPIELYKNGSNLHNNAPIINSSDGYWYAKGAIDRIDKEPSKMSPIDAPLSILTEFVYHITPFSFEEVIFFIPIFFASLIVIPLVLIGKEMGNPLLGFVVALLSVSADGFFTRTMGGYYDDDFFTLILPFWLLYFMIAVVNGGESLPKAQNDIDPLAALPLQNDKKVACYDTALILGVATIFFYHWWYKNGPIIITGLLGTMFFFTLLFYRKNQNAWIFLIVGFIANLKTVFLLKFSIVIAMLLGWIFFRNYQKIKVWGMVVYGVIASIMFVNSGLFVELIKSFDSYISKKVTSAGSGEYGLHYFNSLQTVSESRAIEFDLFFKMIAWSEWLFLLGSLGYFIAAFRYRYLWFGFPLYFIGLSAADAGARFVGYGSPLVMIGVAYLAYLISDKISRIYRLSFLYPILGLFVLIYPMYETYKNVKKTTPPPSFLSYETDIMERFKEIASREDYVISWWDYGYPIRYYADVMTHSDGGMQNGSLTYMESLALMSDSQALAANLLREGIEIKEMIEKEGLPSSGGTFGDIMKYGTSGETKRASTMIEKLKAKEYIPHPKSRDIYWMMMYRMLPILGTIKRFSDYDLQTREVVFGGLYTYSPTLSEDEKEMRFAEGLVYDKQNSMLLLPNGMAAKVKEVISVQDMKDGSVVKSVEKKQSGDGLYIVKLLSTGGAIILDEAMMKSNFIQMFVFNTYDPNYFEAVVLNPLIKIYRLKR